MPGEVEGTVGDPNCICQGTGLTTRLTQTGNTGPEVCDCVARLARSQERQRREEAESAYTSLCHELARLLGPIKPRMGATTNEQLIAKVGQVLTERDEAAQQERQRVREAVARIGSFEDNFGRKVILREDALATLDSLEDEDA